MMRAGVVLLLSGCATGAPAANVGAPAPESHKPMIVQAGDPVLRSPAREVPVESIPSPDMQALFDRMIDTMRKAPGVGLAAPQIGVPWRVIVLEDRAELMSKLTAEEIAERGRVAFAPRVFVNPTLRVVEESKASFFEGCLSVEGYTAVVSRAIEVEVSGFDRHGQPSTWRVRGWPARILQHEVDHLEGTLYVDRMHTRSFMSVPSARARFAGKPIASVLQSLGITP